MWVYVGRERENVKEKTATEGEMVRSALRTRERKTLTETEETDSDSGRQFASKAKRDRPR